MATQNLESILQQIRELATELGATEQVITRLDKALRAVASQHLFEATDKEIISTRNEINKLFEVFTKFSKLTGKPQLFEELNKEINKYNVAVDKLKKEQADITSSHPFFGVDPAAKQSLSETGTKVKEISSETVKAEKATEQLGSAWKKVGTSAEEAGKRIKEAGQGTIPSQGGTPASGSPILGEEAGSFISTGLKNLGIDSSAIEIQNKLNEALKAYELNLSNITGVTQNASTGISLVNAELVTEEGAVRNVTLEVDKLSNVTAKTSQNFQTFGGQLKASIQNFLKWGLAAMVVYQPLNAIQEQIQILVENQTELANIAVIVGNSQDELAQAFDAVSVAAETTAESVSGVLEGYSQALRSTGNIEDQYTRTAVASQLLTDSLVLSKLSTFNQAQAMDTLVASLRQADIPLENGVELLDQWVATTKIANVDLRTLAESYAIVGSVAQSAGIEIKGTNNELVGLIAVLAEQTQLTSTQTGNALRAIITGVGTDVAERNLQQYGISVRNLSGEMRDFLDIAEEINQKFRAGIISESDITKISRAIGGGTRRQPQVEIVLKGLNRAQEVNAAVANAQGDAYEALEVRIDNLNDAITNLGNALQSLLQTWGGEGGFLELAEVTVDVLTGLIRILDSVSSSLGKNIPILLAIAGAGIYGRANQGTNLLGGLATNIGNSRLGGTGVGGFLSNQRNLGFVGAGIATGIPAISNVAEGDLDEAGANVIGGAIGAAIGSTFGPQGTIIGASIGSSIAEAFVKGTKSSADDLASALAERYIEERRRAEEGDTGGLKDLASTINQEDLDQLATKMGGFFDTGLARMRTNLLASIVSFSTQNLALGDTQALTKEEVLLGWGLQGRGIGGGGDEIANQILADFEESFKFTEQGADFTNFAQTGKDLVEDFNKTILDIQNELRDETLGEVLQGGLPAKEIESRYGLVSGLPSFLQGLLAVSDITGGGIGINADELEEVSRTYVSATEEQRASILRITSEIQGYADGIEQVSDGVLTAQGFFEAFGLTTVEAEARMKELANAEADLIGELARRQAYEEYKEVQPTRIATGTEQFGQDVVGQIVERASFRQEEFLDTFPSDEIADLWLETIDGVLFEFEDGTIQAFNELTGLAPEFVRKAIEELKETGVIQDETSIQNPSFLNVPFDYGSSTGQSILGGQLYQSLAEQLGQLGYIEQLEDTIVVYEDKKLEAQKLDSTIVQMLLSQIEENTSDMVDGIYNLPTDGTFFVPWTGAATAVNQGGGTGGLRGYSSIGGGPPTVDENQIAEIMASPDGGTYESRRDAMLEYFYDQTRAELSGGASTFGEDSYESRREELQNQYQQGDETSLKFNGNELTADKMATLMDGLSSSLSNSILGSPINVTVDINAMFETFIDGESVAQISKKFITEEMIRERNTQGTSIDATI